MLSKGLLSPSFYLLCRGLTRYLGWYIRSPYQYYNWPSALSPFSEVPFWHASYSSRFKSILRPGPILFLLFLTLNFSSIPEFQFFVNTIILGWYPPWTSPNPSSLCHITYWICFYSWSFMLTLPESWWVLGLFTEGLPPGFVLCPALRKLWWFINELKKIMNILDPYIYWAWWKSME